jgi:hypothetical protein
MRPARRVFVFVSFLLAAACGSGQGSQPNARILPVESLPVQGLSLADPQGQCVALKSFVEGFSAQHASSRYGGVQCSDDGSTGLLKLSFEFKAKNSDDAGRVIVRRLKTSQPFEVFLCRIVRKAGQEPASSCSGIEGGAKGKGVPKAWRENPLRLDDFVYSLQDFMQR